MFRIVLFALALAALVAPSATAQNAVLSELYGRGVHAYYSNDLATAHEFLTKAIDGGIQDPRAHYYRGLTNLASGRDADAETDYRAGAKLEAQGSFASVGPSLTRVQGSTRIKIENIRQQARLEYQSSAAARSKARYGEIGASDVLRERPVPASPPSRRPAAPVVPPAANPFAGNNAAGQPTVESPDALGGTMTDPFADDAAPATPGTATPAPVDDPFGGGSAPAAAADPFGSGSAPASDPFGSSSAPADDPFQ